MAETPIPRLSEIRKDQPRHQRKLRNVNQQTAWDAETQKMVMSLKEENYNLPIEPPFIKLYTDNLSALFKLSGGENGVLYALAKRVDYDGFLTINTPMKKRIAHEIGSKSLAAVSNAIAVLKREGLIKNTGERGEYMLNPNLFAKGDWKAIEIMRKLYSGISVTMAITDGGVEYNSEMIPKTPVDDTPHGDPDLDQIDLLTGKTKREMLAEAS